MKKRSSFLGAVLLVLSLLPLGHLVATADDRSAGQGSTSTAVLDDTRLSVNPRHITMSGEAAKVLGAVLGLRQGGHAPVLTQHEQKLDYFYVTIDRDPKGQYLVAIVPNELTGPYARMDPKTAPPLRTFLYTVAASGNVLNCRKQ